VTAKLALGDASDKENCRS